MALPVINTRDDLDHLKGTAAYDEFMAYLKGSMSHKVDKAVYPEGYGQPDYTGEPVTPDWQDVEDLSVITRFGFTKADFA